MELKLGKRRIDTSRFKGSNRTFMELKLHTRRCTRQNEVTSSNRTFMELKQAEDISPLGSKGSSNRTFMELKLLNTRHINVLEESSNRTFMELKHRRHKQRYIPHLF